MPVLKYREYVGAPWQVVGVTSEGIYPQITVTGLKETDTVYASKDGKTVQGKLAQKPNSAVVVPDGYTQLEYIESTGTQYIDSEYSGGISKVVDKVSIATTYGAMSGWSSDTNTFRELIRESSLRFTLGNNVDTTNVALSQNTTYSIEFGISGTSYVVKVNGATATSGTFSGSVSPQGNVYLFCENASNSPSGYARIKRYKYEMYDSSGNLVRNYIPAKRNSDNAIGMYDLANDIFYTNAGTGAFIAGAEIPSTVDCFLISPLKELGTWTLTATNGVDTEAQQVLVDTVKYYETEMSGFNKLWLYRKGNECVDVTGGWTGGQASDRTTYDVGTLTKNASNMVITAPVANGWYWTITKNKINLSEYSKIYIEHTSTKPSTNNPSILLTTEGSMASKVGQVELSPVGTKLTEFIDLSEVNDVAYVAVSVAHGATATVSRIWLE